MKRNPAHGSKQFLRYEYPLLLETTSFATCPRGPMGLRGEAMASSRRTAMRRIGALVQVGLGVFTGLVSLFGYGVHRLVVTYRTSEEALRAALRREAELMVRVKELSSKDSGDDVSKAFQEHNDALLEFGLERPSTPTARPTGSATDPFDCYFEDCSGKLEEPARQRQTGCSEFEENCAQGRYASANEASPMPSGNGECGNIKQTWRAASLLLATPGAQVLSQHSSEHEDSKKYARGDAAVAFANARNLSAEAVVTAETAKTRLSRRCSRVASSSESAALAAIKAALTEEVLRGERSESTTYCSLGATRKEQLLWLKKRRAPRVTFALITFELTCAYPRLAAIRSLLASVRDGGFGQEGQFVFVAADAAAMVALCAAGLPAVASTEEVDDAATRVLKAAVAEGRLRQGRRLLASTSGAPFTDAVLFEALLADTAFGQETSAKQRHGEGHEGVELRSSERARDATRFEFAAELAIRGISSLCVDAEATFFAPRRGSRRARHALHRELDDDTRRRPRQRDAQREIKKRPPVRIATRQASFGLPCASPFFAADAGNSSSMLLRRLAKLAKTARSDPAYARGVAAELRLGTNLPGALSSLVVACAPRPHFVLARRDDLAAVVIESKSGRAAPNRRALAAELGLLLTNDDESKLLALRDAVIDLYDPRIYRSLRYLRLVVAHLVAAALLTRRALVLPAVNYDERTYFLWTYLDLESLDDLGIQWRHTHYLAQAPKPITSVASIFVDAPIVVLDTETDRRFFDTPRSIYPERALWTLLSERHDERLLVLHLPFIAKQLGRMVTSERAVLNAAFVVVKKLRWCDTGLSASIDSTQATASDDCYGNGVLIEADLALSRELNTGSSSPAKNGPSHIESPASSRVAHRRPRRKHGKKAR